MKLADDFLSKCLNFDAWYQSIKKTKTEECYYYGSYGDDFAHTEIGNQLFLVEEEDFNIAIKLCKQYKRVWEQKSYQHHLEQFKETGTYPCDYHPAEFITRLSRDLRGRRNKNSDTKDKLIATDLNREFPEWKEIRFGSQLLSIVSNSIRIEKRLLIAQNEWTKHQELINSIHEATDAGKSVLEIVGQLNEQDED